MTVVARRDGGLEDMEMNGTLTLRIADESFRRIKLQLKGETLKDSQGRDLVQLHMNLCVFSPSNQVYKFQQ